MGCFHSKETFFGRAHGYVVCRNFQTSGHVRCPKERCSLFADDGRGTEPSLIGKCAAACHFDVYDLRKTLGQIDGFCDAAAQQTPDDGGGDIFS